MHWINLLSAWMREHLSQIAFSISAMILVIGSPYIHAGAKSLSRNFHWLVRYALFVLLTTVGYGLIANFGLLHMRGFLLRMTGGQLVFAVLSAHLILAWLLKRDKAF